jgi:hypothetical protein
MSAPARRSILAAALIAAIAIAFFATLEQRNRAVAASSASASAIREAASAPEELDPLAPIADEPEPRASERAAVEPAVETPPTAAAVGSNDIDVLGLAVDAAGIPVTLFGVRATRLDASSGPADEVASESADSIRRVREEGITLHPRGEFEMRGLPRGRWLIEPFADEMLTAWRHIAVETSPERIVFVMNSAAIVTGVVLDGDAQPVAGAEVTVDSRVSAQPTDGLGRFRLQLYGGEHALLATADGYLPSERRELSVAMGDRVDDVELSLHAGGTLRGVVLDESGAPIAGCGVSVGASANWILADSNGVFEVSGLAAGRLNVLVRTPSPVREHPWLATALIEANKTTTIELRIVRERPVRVLGRIEKPGIELKGAIVRAIPVGGQLMRTGIGVRDEWGDGSGKYVRYRDGRVSLRGVVRINSQPREALGQREDGEVADDGRFELSLSTPGRYEFQLTNLLFHEPVAPVIVDVPDQDVFELTLEP